MTNNFVRMFIGTGVCVYMVHCVLKSENSQQYENIYKSCESHLHETFFESIFLISR